MRLAWVIGASGFVGRALMHALEADGWTTRGTSLTHPRDGLESLDVRDATAVDRAIGECDVVFDLAADKRRAFEHVDEVARVNVGGVANVLAALARRGSSAPAAVFLGSGEEYGRCADLPYREDAMAQPLSAYGATKLAATQLALAAGPALATVVIRPSVVYGPGQPSEQLVACAVRAALADEACVIRGGTQTRDFVYVDDLADALVRAASAAREDARGRVINVGSGEEHSSEAVARRVMALAGKGRVEMGPASERVGDTARIVYDVSLAKRVLGWSAGTSLDEGLERTLRAARG